MAEPEALSGNESIKRKSRFLKGNVAAELADSSRGDVSDETYELLKFHGSYFGHNRDTATERKKQGLEKEYEFMIRTRIPAGRLTAQQYLAMDDLAGKYANGTLRITTRQVFQFHVVLKENLKNHIAAINHALLSTQSGCGDVVRNVTTSPAPINDVQHKRLREDADRVAAFVRPKTSAYRELWLDEEADEIRERDILPTGGAFAKATASQDIGSRAEALVEAGGVAEPHPKDAGDAVEGQSDKGTPPHDSASVEGLASSAPPPGGSMPMRDAEGKNIITGASYEPLYGDTYLPRKFKIGLITPEDNSIDVFTHDLGIVLIFEGDTLKGYNLLLGGGMGMKHEPNVEWKDKKTYPRLATPIAFAGPEDLLNAVEAVIKLQRDWGDRKDRQHARLKYVVQERGAEWVRRTLEDYFNATRPKQKLKDPILVAKYQIPSHMGWHDQKDGKLYLGLPVPSGRIVDYDKPDQSGYTKQVTGHFKQAQYRTGLREIIKEYGMNLVLTPTEEIILCDIAPSQKEEIEKKLKSYHIPLAEEHTPMQLHFMTCVALPTCAKALAESERVQFPLSDSIQAAMDRNGVGKEKITVRVVGCPNGCARPYVGDIGIVGRMPGHYVLFIGGDFEGTRLNTKVFDKVPQDEIAAALDPMFALYAKEKQTGEGFGDFCHRYGVERVVENVRGKLKNYKWAA